MQLPHITTKLSRNTSSRSLSKPLTPSAGRGPVRDVNASTPTSSACVCLKTLLTLTKAWKPATPCKQAAKCVSSSGPRTLTTWRRCGWRRTLPRRSKSRCSIRGRSKCRLSARRARRTTPSNSGFLGTMSIRKAYTEWATSYDSDRNLTRDLDQEVTRATLGQQQYNTIIELGCGTGKNTPLFAEIGERVYATDFSEGMIAQAKAKLHLSNVTFTVADLTQAWPYADQCADLIVCNLILEHIADLGFIFTEGHRVLADGGRFFISELHSFKQYVGKKATFLRGDQQTRIPEY